MTRLCFIDTETTSLRPDRRAWDIALIVREDGREDEHQWFIDSEDLDLGNADLISLGIGRFHERHPQYNAASRGAGTWPAEEPEALGEIEMLTRGGHLIGAVPNFDAEVLATRMRAHGICPSWHYHLIDVETLAVGWITRSDADMGGTGIPVELPWKSDDLSAVLGITVSDEDRHTALGDARWARAIYDAIIARG